jgi:hypothetical protein
MLMPAEYLALAAERSATQCAPYCQPEYFGYEFLKWVSPITKGAHKRGGLVFVYQDWGSVERLSGGPNPEIQLHGRLPTLLTNRRFDVLLDRVFRLRLSDVYVTNAFPYVKRGSMSSALPFADVRNAASKFLVRELELAKPTIVFALGGVAHAALRQCGVSSIRLPHPAARIGGVAKHEAAWRAALCSASASTLLTAKDHIPLYRGSA